MTSGRLRRRLSRAILPLIILMLGGSALLRLGEGSGFAFARDSVPDLAAAQTPAPEPTMDEEALGMLIARLRAREADIARREEALEARSATLDRLSAEIEARLQDLSRAEEALRATMALADTAAEDDLTRLTAVYENMKPKEAAALFETMEPAFAAGFLARMKATSAAAVMSGLAPETAYAISLILSGRNMGAPTE